MDSKIANFEDIEVPDKVNESEEEEFNEKARSDV
eukprot:CAMPEP_0176378080 /NCGR_PEP_ID=MMETSP0126-20121128/29356_1 /TAXON_ID=141414 ORGANISM="Strombidinopsis acuminatum, Strain SPMC142" /NCGR_SAMPLE_ID=MMETSP0126 /ASSEMBLY_ACC=CAM_ASM_000229 /LENGTH=33 /DNA_ID= /DNA_START= /DNA_END= /DNA_ORIENTATION=